MQFSYTGMKTRDASPGPYSVPPEVMKALQELCNQCLAQGKLAKIWKQADVVIIKENKDKNPSNQKIPTHTCLLNVLREVQ